MNKTIIAVALLLAIGVPSPSAIAQSGNAGASKSGSGGGGVLPAPVGHRQPRAGDVPDEKNLSNPNDPVNKEDALLDKKIKSICRGC
jgi:hypothetical protein